MATTTAKGNYVFDFLNLIEAKLNTNFCDIYFNFLDDKFDKQKKVQIPRN